ncbi:hypothetical protein ACLBOM_22655 [Escherichia coli]
MEYVPEAPRHSDWQRPTFAFEGRRCRPVSTNASCLCRSCASATC